MYKIVISDDEGKTTVVPLVRDEITIGRKEGNTIRLTERNVSRRHARLRKANGAYALEDLGSYNGVRLNGRRIDNEAVLKAGDQIAIGDYLLALQVDAIDQAETKPTPSTPVSEANTAFLATPKSPARVVMLTPPAPGAEFALSKARMRIGRAEDLDIWVNHRSISREHAELVKDVGPDGKAVVVRVQDLSSANGTRVNNKEIQQATLIPGDMLEVGQVRFRFVGEGESYTFDADRTVQMDAVQAAPQPSRAPLIAALALILVSIPIAILLVTQSNGPRRDGHVGEVASATGVRPLPAASTDIVPQPRESVSPSPPEEGVVASPSVGTPPPEVQLAALLRACDLAIRDGRWSDASASASAALALSPQDATARACAGAADDGTLLATAMALLSGADGPARAHAAVQAIPQSSPVRARPELASIERQFFATRLESLREELARGRIGAVQRGVEELMAVPELPDDVRSALSALRAEAVPREPREQVASTGNSSAQSSRSPRNSSNHQGNSTTNGSSRSGSTATAVIATVPSPSPSPTARPAAGGADANRCLSESDYSACVIRTLGGGRARSDSELALLAITYKETQDRSRAIATMQDYLRRYPSGGRANAFRQYLQRNGAEVP